MNNVVDSPLVVRKLRDLRMEQLTDSQHLSNAYLTQPDETSKMVTFALQKQTKSILTMLGGMSNTREIESREWKWDLMGMRERISDVIVTSPDATANSNQPGLNRSTFRVYVNDYYFVQGDVLNSDNGTQIRVQEIPYKDDIALVLVCQIVDPNIRFISPDQISLGAQFNKDYNTQPEGSMRGGTTAFEAGMQMVNQLTILRQTYGFTRSAATDVMVIEVKAPNGESSKYWTKVAEWAHMVAWEREKERLLMYATHSKDGGAAVGVETVMGDNGRFVSQGAGLRQQISASNIRAYSFLTYEFLETFLLDLAWGADQYGGSVDFLALTGKGGMIEFNRAIQDKRIALGVQLLEKAIFIGGNGQELELHGAFTKVVFPSGNSFKITEFTPYNDTVRFRTKHPITNLPVESYRFTLLNFGSSGTTGEQNIRMVAKKGAMDIADYVCGLWGPTLNGSQRNKGASSGFDGYELHKLCEIGAQMSNPLENGELIYVPGA